MTGQRRVRAAAAASLVPVSVAAFLVHVGEALAGLAVALAVATSLLVVASSARASREAPVLRALSVPAAVLVAVAALPPTGLDPAVRLVLLGTLLGVAGLFTGVRPPRDVFAGRFRILLSGILALGIVAALPVGESMRRIGLEVAAAFVAGLVAEAFFRRVFQPALAEGGPGAAVVVAGVAYGALLLAVSSPAHAFFSLASGWAYAAWSAWQSAPSRERAPLLLRGAEYAALAFR